MDPSTELLRVTKEAHGCSLPSVASHFLGDLGNETLYDVYLLDWNVKIAVAMDTRAVIALLVLNKDLHPDVDGIAARIRTYKVRVLDAIAYALVTFGAQPEPVQAHLRNRFGPLLRRMRQLAREHWAGMVVR